MTRKKERIGDSWKDSRLSSPPPRPRVWLQEGRADAAAAVCRGTTASGQSTERRQRRCQRQVTSCAGSYECNFVPAEIQHRASGGDIAVILECLCLELSPDHWYTQHVNELSEKAGREQMALVHPPEDRTLMVCVHRRMACVCGT
jgi:hypothetical protein